MYQIIKFAGWTQMVTDVDKDGDPIGGYLFPPDTPKELIDKIKAYLKQKAGKEVKP